jgi:hypothetical protein
MAFFAFIAFFARGEPVTPARSARSYLLEARRRWPRAIWIMGNGEYASVSYCRAQPTVMLFETLAEAERAKKAIDDTACGGRCMRRHEIVQLGLVPYARAR